MGIIDTLTSYNGTKRLEKYAKFAMFKGSGVSVSARRRGHCCNEINSAILTPTLAIRRTTFQPPQVAHPIKYNERFFKYMGAIMGEDNSNMINRSVTTRPNRVSPPFSGIGQRPCTHCHAHMHTLSCTHCHARGHRPSDCAAFICHSFGQPFS